MRGAFVIHFDSEKAFEDFMYENSDHFKEEFGHEFCERQVRLGAYGVCDLLFWEIEPKECSRNNKETICINLVELKNTRLEYKHIGQCARYKRFFEEYSDVSEYNICFSASLIGLKTMPDDTDFCFLAQSIDWLSVEELSLDPAKGVDFKAIYGWRKGEGVSLVEASDFDSFFIGGGVKNG